MKNTLPFLGPLTACILTEKKINVLRRKFISKNAYIFTF